MVTDSNDDDCAFEREYSILELYTQFGRWTDGYTEDMAVEDYLELHPEAKESDVREELQRELAKLSK